MALWNTDTIRDVAESVGITDLNEDVAKNLSMDVEYRLHQVLQEALKFMRHSKRTTLGTSDITHALRVLNVEPLYGYESTKPLKFCEASLGHAKPIFYVEDDEVDFEKLINAPLPKVPREVTFTAHWLAIEGVQPAIPQNPTATEAARLSEIIPKGSNSTSLAATAGNSENVAVKPLVKHILSKELQLYFERVCTAVLDEHNEALRTAGLSSLRNDPGLHQLLPYFLQFIAEKVTHTLRNLFVLGQMMELAHALLENESLFIEPYIASIVPPILTCLVGRRLGNSPSSPDHYQLRDFAASLIKLICKRFGDTSHTLRPRLTRTCLKHFLDPAKPFGTHYGALNGLAAIGGKEAIRALVVPNLELYDKILKNAIEEGGVKEKDAQILVSAILNALKLLETEEGANGFGPGINGKMQMNEETKARLMKKVGEVVGGRIWAEGKEKTVLAVLGANV